MERTEEKKSVNLKIEKLKLPNLKNREKTRLKTRWAPGTYGTMCKDRMLMSLEIQKNNNKKVWGWKSIKINNSWQFPQFSKSQNSKNSRWWQIPDNKPKNICNPSHIIIKLLENKNKNVLKQQEKNSILIVRKKQIKWQHISHQKLWHHQKPQKWNNII